MCEYFIVSTTQKQFPSTPVRPNGSVPPLLPDWSSPGSALGQVVKLFYLLEIKCVRALAKINSIYPMRKVNTSFGHGICKS